MYKIVSFLGLSLLSMQLIGADIKEHEVNALNVPERGTTGCHRSWNCGPDTIARFCVLAGLTSGYSLNEYKTITTNCPRSCGMPVTNKGYAAVACLGAMSASLLSTGSYEYGFLGIIPGILALAPFAIEAYNSFQGIGNVGPTPHWLVQYANKFLDAQNWQAHLAYKQFENENEMLNFIKDQLEKNPVIVLVNYDTLAWHYYSVIKHNKNDRSFTCIDGTCRYERNSDQLKDEMDFEKTETIKSIKTLLQNIGPILSVDIGRFNIIYIENLL